MISLLMLTMQSLSGRSGMCRVRLSMSLTTVATRLSCLLPGMVRSMAFLP